MRQQLAIYIAGFAGSRREGATPIEPDSEIWSATTNGLLKLTCPDSEADRS